MLRLFWTLLAALLLALPASAQSPLRIEITDGVIEPLPFAVPSFQPETGGSEQVASDISRLIAQDLANTGLFREVPSSAFISQVSSFTAPVAYADWRAINAQALITGAVSVSGNQLIVKFRLYDVFSGAELGAGQQLAGTVDGWRRMAHKVADQVYSRITGEGGYFDSRVVFVSETGPKDNRARRLAIMDFDGANIQYLTDSSALVLGPRFSPTGDRVLFTSYASGGPAVNILQVAAPAAQRVATANGETALAASFSPDGRRMVYSVASGGNSDLWITDLSTGQHMQLTNAPSIETSPSFSPDGSQIVFESDRSGTQQIYIMSAGGGEARRVSAGEGRYGSPVWSPRGDLIAFTKQNAGRFHIGVMRTDGSEERLLTSSFLDESPTWAPNGRVLMFQRETQGASGGPSLYTVDISGRNLRQVTTPSFAAGASWGPLQP
jgi:TolB protein